MLEKKKKQSLSRIETEKETRFKDSPQLPSLWNVPWGMSSLIGHLAFWHRSTRGHLVIYLDIVLMTE